MLKIKFLYWLTGNLPCRIIPRLDPNGEYVPYLERYLLFSIFGYNFYIHRLLSADYDGVHNHPWYLSFAIVLCGRYREEVFLHYCQHNGWISKFRWVRFNWIPGNKFHRITSVSKNTYTLFVHSKRQRDDHERCSGWGFLNKEKHLYCDNLKIVKFIPYTYNGQILSGEGPGWSDPNIKKGKFCNREPIYE